jgi:hypothetical protein
VRIEIDFETLYTRAMRILTTSLLVLLAPLACAQSLTQAQKDAAVATYRALAEHDVEAKPLEAAPSAKVSRVDVSQRIRSASFGHTTTLLVPDGGKQFWVEWGKSTNRPASWYGPFDVK